MDGVYWDESHCYRFTAGEIDELEAATRELHQLALTAVEHIVTRDRFEQLAIAPGFAERISTSWRSRVPHFREAIEADRAAPALLLAALSVSAGMLNAASLSY